MNTFTPPQSPPITPSLRKALPWICLLLAAIALRIWHGPVLQSAGFHDFADKHDHLGVPMAADVLSNLGFVLAGLIGWRALVRRQERAPLATATLLSAAAFFAGLLFTAIGSALYHLAPENTGLAVDRFCMTIAFAGILGWFLAEQSSTKLAQAALPWMLLAFPATVLVWHASGDLFAYVLVQFAGMALLLWLAFAKPSMRKAGIGVIAWYAAAKVCETFDHQIYHATMELVSGHTLKHLFAAAAALPLIHWLNTTK